MTIKIEREALFLVLSNDVSHSPLPKQQAPSTSKSKSDEPAIPTPWIGYQECVVSNLRIPTVEKSDSFDDDCTVTTASSSSCSSLELDERRVSFFEPLVTEVRTRPRTPRDEVSKLFYSCDETARFRQEYRLERKMLAELEVDPATHPVDTDDLSLVFENQPSSRHRISRVVVMHNDKLETFFNPDTLTEKSTTDRCGPSDDFFDSDSFWSGSITWY